MSFTRPGTPPPNQPPTPGWGQSLSAGAAGLALLHLGYAHAGLGDRATAHQWVRAMLRQPVAADRTACLYRGAPAVAFVLRSARLPAYTGALRTLDEHVAAITRARLDQAVERIDRGDPPPLREFDLINGLTGLGAGLLHAIQVDPPHHHHDLLCEVLTYLVHLAGTITIDGTRLPGWWTRNGPADRPDPRWAGGHANLGMAHGIAGPLTLLSAAMIHGVCVSGQADAIDRIDGFLDAWRCGPTARPWWPGLISARDWAGAITHQPGPQRPSWCYGTPGIARARHLAAQALDFPRRRQRAETALAACLSDTTQLHQLRDDTLCHGWAGLVHTARRMSADTAPDSPLVDALPRLEHRWRRRRATGELSDHNGMLEGSAGIALTDLTPHAIGWDICLLTTPPPTSVPAATTSHLEGPG